MGFHSLKDVLQEQLEDLHSAETQLVAALPKMAQAASNQELRGAFEHHLQETQDHVQRLEEIFGQLGISGSGETCDAMRGLVKEGEKTISTDGDPTAKDAALIAAAERPEIVHAVISHDGRPELAGGALERVEAPTLLIVDPAEQRLLELNRDAMHRMRAHVELEMAASPRVPALAAEWCQRYLWSMA